MFGIVSSTYTKPANNIIKTKVAILGGGMAGITAAKTLANELNITDFLVIEARHELGGRVQNVLIDNKYSVEIGANWIQGLGTNPIWALAQKYDVKNIYSNWSDITYYDNKGWQGVGGPTEKAIERFDGPVFDAFSEMAEVNNASGLADTDMKSALRRVGWIGENPSEWAAEYLEFDWEQAEPPVYSSFYHFVQSYVSNFEDVGNSDNNFAVDPRGFKRIVSGQAKEVRDFDKKVKYNHTVKTIEYSGSGVKITTTEGVVIQAEYALCTFSAGVLQHNDVKFIPPFPDWKASAISQMHMATYTKIFARFPSIFWNSTQFTVYTDPIERGYYSVWQNIDVKGFLPGSKIFFATLTSDQAYRAEHQTDEQVKADFMRVLRSMYGRNIPNPTHFVVPRWTRNPLFRGTYSNWGAGVTVEQFDNVRAPLGSKNDNISSTKQPGGGDRLWFAGEHTSRKYFGFLQGAYYSGLAAAHHIADCIHNNCYESRRTVRIVEQIEEPPIEYPVIKMGQQKGRRW
ncbi:hypothetical protein ABW20_dc0108064 [Dactylellina cionopaga]|nr:hypothetical protein ABW20_dc0108064 [Dactylellina cionopaga]